MAIIVIWVDPITTTREKQVAKSKGKAAVAEIEDDDIEIEELTDDEASDTPPAKSKKGGVEEVEFGVADLCALVKEKTGKDYSTRDMRTLLRKMAREDTPRVEREVIAGNRARYNWPGGVKNPEVKKVIAAVTGGEIEEGKKEALAKLKENKAKKTAKEEKNKKSKKSKAAADE